MNTILIPLLQVIGIALDLYRWVVIVAVIFSWLISFGVINSRNEVVRIIGNIVYQLTEPLLRRIRRVVPMAGGLDLSPVILLLLVYLVQLVLGRLIANLAVYG
jgi:YggT family protein